MDFSPKRAGEVEIFTIDFAPILAPAETLLTAVWSASVVAGVDQTPNAIISGVSIITGTKVSQFVAGGVVGVTYAPVCTITTSFGQTLTLPTSGDGLLLISP